MEIMMSTTVRKNISAALIEEEYVEPEKKKQCLQTGIYDVTKRAAFLGSVLQCLDIEYTHIVARAGIMFDADGKKWKMAINPYWFCEQLEQKNRCGVLLHEIYHITHKHPMRAPYLKINPFRRHLMNVAMDMAINQYIQDLPNGCQECPPIEDQFKGARCQNKKCPGGAIRVEDYYDFDQAGNKKPWEHKKAMEFYYHKLIERYKQAESESGGGDDANAVGQGNGEGLPEEFDAHNWDGSAEESEMMDATEDLVKRAMQKRGLTYDKLPGFIQELLQDIEARRNELNYRQLILSAIKRHASGFDREHSWMRRSRRFGLKAPGTRSSQLPFLDNYIDSSGSISVQEANDFLDIIDSFLKVGSRKCDLNLWHTNVYYSEKYKLGDRLDRKTFQSGGTDVGPTLEKIFKKQPDLAIILTDGCYCDVKFEEWLKPNEHPPQVLWIISRDGNENHPLRRLGETIKIPNTDHYGKDKRLEEQ
jgi:predicted metal-dependent peptidase